jgi:hypothetical protein
LVKKRKTKKPDWMKMDWDWLQRRRFANVDSEITPPKDKYSKKIVKVKE